MELATFIKEWKKFFVGLLMGAVSFYLLSRIPEAVDFYRIKAPLRQMAAEAKVYNLSYEQALIHPADALWKPVRWFLTHPDRKRWLYEGKAAMPISWRGTPPEMSETGQSGSSHGQYVVARIVNVSPSEITLQAYILASTESIVTSFKTSR